MLGDGGDFSSIIGQLEITSSINGAPIDTSTKSDDDFVTLLDGELSTKGAALTGTLIYNSSASYRVIRTAQTTHVIKDFKLSFNDTNEVDLYISGIINGLSDSKPIGDKLVTSFSVISTGDVFSAIPYIPVGSDGYITSDGKRLLVRL